MKLWKKILIGLVLGSVFGFILGPKAEILKPVGTLFLRMINMIIPLLVLSSMAVGISNIHDPKKMGRVGIKTLSLYLITTFIAIVIGLAFAYLIQPGTGLALTISDNAPITPHLSIGEILFSIVPSNPFTALAEGNILQVIVFALFLGIAVSFAGEKGKPLLRVLESLAEVMYKLTSIVIGFSPYGVFAIMAWVSGSFGFAVFLPLGKFLLSFYLACGVHVVLVFCGILWCLARLRVGPFFSGMKDAMLMAFSTCSSSATLPVSMNCAQDNLGVSKNISGFMLPLGATINMNGTAIFQASSAIFIAQAYGIPLGFSQIITIILTSTLSAIGTAGIPGSGFIMLAAVISSVGLPLEGIVILAAIDRLREMGATVLNILGDAVCAIYVAKQEGEFDEEKYYSQNAEKLTVS